MRDRTYLCALHVLRVSEYDNRGPDGLSLSRSHHVQEVVPLQVEKCQTRVSPNHGQLEFHPENLRHFGDGENGGNVHMKGNDGFVLIR